MPPFPTGSTPVTPVVNGRPVSFVRVPDPGVPNAIPAESEFAVTVPEPVGLKLAPVPTSIAAVVFVPLVIELKADDPPPPPQSTPVPEIRPVVFTCKHCVEPVMPVSVRELNDPAAGVALPIAGGVDALAVAKVPKPMTLEFGSPVAFVSTSDEGVPKAGVTSVGDVARTLFPLPVVVPDTSWPEALEPSTEALTGTGEPLILTTVAASVPVVVTSPDKFPPVIVLAPENVAIFPLTGDPEVVTVPLPPPTMIWPNELVASAGALTGSAPPFTLTTVVARLPAVLVASPVCAGS